MKFKLLVLRAFVGFRLQRLLIQWGWLRLSPLKQRRFRRLRKHLRLSPFYRDQSLRNLPLQDFPIINKSIFMENFDQINTVGISREDAWSFAMEAEKSRDFSADFDHITVGLSSGTSGNYGIFLANDQERARWVAAILDRVIGFSIRRRKVAFFLRADSKLYQSVRSRLLDFRFFDITLPFSNHLPRLHQYQPDILIAQPSVLTSIAQSVEAKEIAVFPEQIISVAEVLEPQLRTWLSEVFGKPVDEVYQCTEGFLAASCSAGNLHFNEDFLILEKKYLDEEQTHFHPIITDLMRFSQPVIRYELDDVIVEEQHCPCGQSSTAIRRIEGRADDVLTLQDRDGNWVRVYPDLMRRAILQASSEIHLYVLTQVDEETLECYLKVEMTASERLQVRKQVEHSLEERLRQLGIGQVMIRFVDSYEHPAGTKLRRVRNLLSITKSIWTPDADC